jgi:hypothetical protein
LHLVLMVFAQRVLGQQVEWLISDQYQICAPWSFAKVIDMIGHLWIPVVVIAFGSTAGFSRIMRANLLDVLNMQYVQTARSKGFEREQRHLEACRSECDAPAHYDPGRVITWHHLGRNGCCHCDEYSYSRPNVLSTPN